MRQIKISITEAQEDYIRAESTRTGNDMSATIRGIIADKMSGTTVRPISAPLAPITAAPVANTTPKEQAAAIDQTGAKFIVTPAKLRDLLACDAVFKDARKAFCYWICSHYTSAVTGKKIIQRVYAENSKLCDLSQFDDLAPAIQAIVTEKMKLYVPEITAEQKKAEADSVTF